MDVLFAGLGRGQVQVEGQSIFALRRITVGHRGHGNKKAAKTHLFRYELPRDVLERDDDPLLAAGVGALWKREVEGLARSARLGNLKRGPWAMCGARRHINVLGVWRQARGQCVGARRGWVKGSSAATS